MSYVSWTVDSCGSILDEKYIAYLAELPAFADLKNQLMGKEVVTLLYLSRDHDHNNSIVVADALKVDIIENI